MKEIKTVALVGLGAIGAYFADRLQPMLGDDLRVIAGGARAERIRREGLIINGKQEYYHVVEPGEGEPADLVITAPVVNTGVFLLGMVLFFQETLRAWAAGSALLTYVLFTLTGVNFLVELGLNLVLSPAVSTLIRAIRKTHN